MCHTRGPHRIQHLGFGCTTLYRDWRRVSLLLAGKGRYTPGSVGSVDAITECYEDGRSSRRVVLETLVNHSVGKLRPQATNLGVGSRCVSGKAL